MPPEASQALEWAHRLLPSRKDLAHNLSLAYAQGGHTAQSQELIQRGLVPRTTPEGIQRASEALLNEEPGRAEGLVDTQRLTAALSLLEAVKAKTRRPQRRDEIERQIEDIRHALNFNAFVERYNQAGGLANHRKGPEAGAIPGAPLPTTQDPPQAGRGPALLERP